MCFKASQTLIVLVAATDPIQLKKFSSDSQEPSDLTKLKETDEVCCAMDTPVQMYAVCFIFAVGVTIALIIKINLQLLVHIVPHILCSSSLTVTAVYLHSFSTGFHKRCGVRS